MITGKTALYGIFGYPLTHTASPAMHNANFFACGLDAVYLPFPVSPEQVADAFKGLCAAGLKGANVTIPHKEQIMRYLNHVDDEARMIGAVNTVVVNDSGETKGYNTDGQGFIVSLKERWAFDLKNKKMLILGAGGGARAVAVTSALAGCAAIFLFDSDRGKAEQLSAHLTAHIPAVQCKTVASLSQAHDYIAASDIMVNATPVGMKESDPLLIDPRSLFPSLYVFDLIYNPLKTRLLDAAQKAGCRVQNGLDMLVNQGALSFHLWTGVYPDRVLMRQQALTLMGIKEV